MKRSAELLRDQRISKNRLWTLMVLLVFLVLTGCSPAGKEESRISESSAVSISSVQPSSSSAAASSETDASQLTEPDPKAGLPTLDEIPAYAGAPYAVIHNNVPYFEENEETTASFQHYFDLDELGRVVQAYGSLGTDLMPDDERGNISSVHPTGFENRTYDFIDNGGSLYNRCHLIAWSLTGQNANPKNLMTGTRSFNVEGMLPFERMVGDYLKATGNHVMYRVTPLFDGNDLVAKGVLMEAKSVEDKGDGIEFCVFVNNVQPGVSIDYATGENYADGTIPIGSADSQRSSSQGPDAQTVPVLEDEQAQSYVLNTNTMKFHRPDCRSVSEMSQRNRQDVTETRQEIINQGYAPCKRCNP